MRDALHRSEGQDLPSPTPIPPGHDLAGPAPDPPGTVYPRNRTPRAVREAQMVAAAERLFSERGYHGVSMDEIAGAIRAEQSGLIAQLLRELPGWTAEPDAEQLDAIAHVFVGAAEGIAFWAVAHTDIPLERVADHLMAVLWPVVRDLPS